MKYAACLVVCVLLANSSRKCAIWICYTNRSGWLEPDAHSLQLLWLFNVELLSLVISPSVSSLRPVCSWPTFWWSFDPSQMLRLSPPLLRCFTHWWQEVVNETRNAVLFVLWDSHCDMIGEKRTNSPGDSANHSDTLWILTLTDSGELTLNFTSKVHVCAQWNRANITIIVGILIFYLCQNLQFLPWAITLLNGGLPYIRTISLFCKHIHFNSHKSHPLWFEIKSSFINKLFKI